VGFSFGWWINQKRPSPKENKSFGSPPLHHQLINTNHTSPKKKHTLGKEKIQKFQQQPTILWWANQKGSLQKQTSDFGRMYFFPNKFLFYSN
jgi:hypothetical protein